uniref:Uncharacterized protein n=1 Tax=Rhizophora mucronata TaxID=61149 RepID=A0A2P2R1X4_RHIMU
MLRMRVKLIFYDQLDIISAIGSSSL